MYHVTYKIHGQVFTLLLYRSQSIIDVTSHRGMAPDVRTCSLKYGTGIKRQSINDNSTRPEHLKLTTKADLEMIAIMC